MSNLEFPKEICTVMPLLSEERIKYYNGVFENLEAIADDMVVRYLDKMEDVQVNETEELLVSTYKLFVQLIEEKVSRIIPLTEQEEEIYKFCLEEISKTEKPSVKGIFSVIWRGIEGVRNIIDDGKAWFGFLTEENKANRALSESGNEVLPQYNKLLGKNTLLALSELYIQTFVPFAVSLSMGQQFCAPLNKNIGTTLPDNKALASEMLELAEFGYHGSEGNDKYKPLKKEDVPSEIQAVYNEAIGYLDCSRGFKAWVGRSIDSNSLIISFSGTHLSNPEHLLADVFQLSAPSVIYLMAVGLVNLIRKRYPSNPIYVTGHSLGGGLTQFSVAACDQLENRNCIYGFGFNPAGLSAFSVGQLGSNIIDCTKRIWMFVTARDIVSPLGGKLGYITTLPKTGSNGHSMDALKKCMEEYVKKNYQSSFVKDEIDVKFLYHYTQDFLPDSLQISIMDQDKNYYPIFSDSEQDVDNSYAKVTFFKTLLRELALPTEKSNKCLGIINKLNGSGHTVMNRLMLIGSNATKIEGINVGDVPSSMFYGPYGIDVSLFIDQFLKACENCGLLYEPNCRNYVENILGELHNPFETELNAWITGIRSLMGVDLQAIFDTHPNAKEYFYSFLYHNMSDRKDIYDKLIAKSSNPTQEEIYAFAIEYGDELSRNADELLFQNAVQYGIISKMECKQYCGILDDFISEFVQGIKNTV